MNVLEELTEFEDQIDRAHVVRRVEDWEKRIDDLYATVGQWLPVGWSSDVSRTVPMKEMLMKKFNVRSRKLPVLQLTNGGMPEAIFEPRGLWIIGDNGRIDLIRGDKHFILTDEADNFETPDWQIVSFLQRRKQRKFNRSVLADVLA